MAFDPVTLQHLEDALSEAFPYHAELDVFVSRCGLSATQLKAARNRAEAKNAGSRFDKAPKRFVAQMIIEDLSTAGDAGDRVIAAMITSLGQRSRSVGGANLSPPVQSPCIPIELTRGAHNEKGGPGRDRPSTGPRRGCAVAG